MCSAVIFKSIISADFQIFVLISPSVGYSVLYTLTDYHHESPAAVSSQPSIGVCLKRPKIITIRLINQIPQVPIYYFVFFFRKIFPGIFSKIFHRKFEEIFKEISRENISGIFLSNVFKNFKLFRNVV